MEVSSLRYSGGIGLHGGRSPLLRLQSDERLIWLIRRGNHGAFEVLVARYQTRLLGFCRHLLGSREDAEDVLQDVLAAAFNAILADDRPINVRPWLYRIARNRSLNHLRRMQAVGVDSMDVHFSDNGASTADKAHEREEFRLLVGDIHELAETQRTALVLREMDALSYEQIAEAMETTVPSVKSLLVRARMSLAEAAEARLLSCKDVRIELAEVAEGIQRRPSPLVRRHLRHCQRCCTFREELKRTNKALAALLPVGPFVALRKLALTHAAHHAGAGSGSTAGAGQAAAVGSGTAAGSGIAIGSGGGLLSAGIGAIATKAAAGLAAAALLAGAVEVGHTVVGHSGSKAHSESNAGALQADAGSRADGSAGQSESSALTNKPLALAAKPDADSTGKLAAAGGVNPTASDKSGAAASSSAASASPSPSSTSSSPSQTSTQGSASGSTDSSSSASPQPQPDSQPPGRTQTQTDPTVLEPPPDSGTSSGSNTSGQGSGSGPTPTSANGSPQPSAASN